MDKTLLLEFLSERNLNLHKEHLENCRMRLSILEKSGYNISGMRYPELCRARLGDARDEILPLAREVYLHEMYFDSFGRGGESSESIKPRYRTVASFLYELERAAMAADGGFLLIARGRSDIDFSHNMSCATPMRYEPCLALDLAEHAYFLDYGFERERYLISCLSYLSLDII